MSKNTVNDLFETCWTPCNKPHLSSWSRSKFTFFWSTPYQNGLLLCLSLSLIILLLGKRFGSFFCFFFVRAFFFLFFCSGPMAPSGFFTDVNTSPQDSMSVDQCKNGREAYHVTRLCLWYWNVEFKEQRIKWTDTQHTRRSALRSRKVTTRVTENKTGGFILEAIFRIWNGLWRDFFSDKPKKLKHGQPKKRRRKWPNWHKKKQILLNPALAHFKGLVKIILLFLVIYD